jgi:hypothetical protein
LPAKPLQSGPEMAKNEPSGGTSARAAHTLDRAIQTHSVPLDGLCGTALGRRPFNSIRLFSEYFNNLPFAPTYKVSPP